jgi:hypothetical protein
MKQLDEQSVMMMIAAGREVSDDDGSWMTS